MIHECRVRAGHVGGSDTSRCSIEGVLSQNPIRRRAIGFRRGIVVTDDAVVVEIGNPQRAVWSYLHGHRTTKFFLVEGASGVGCEIGVTQDTISVGAAGFVRGIIETKNAVVAEISDPKAALVIHVDTNRRVELVGGEPGGLGHEIGLTKHRFSVAVDHEGRSGEPQHTVIGTVGDEIFARNGINGDATRSAEPIRCGQRGFGDKINLTHHGRRIRCIAYDVVFHRRRVRHVETDHTVVRPIGDPNQTCGFVDEHRTRRCETARCGRVGCGSGCEISLAPYIIGIRTVGFRGRIFINGDAVRAFLDHKQATLAVGHHKTKRTHAIAGDLRHFRREIGLTQNTIGRCPSRFACGVVKAENAEVSVVGHPQGAVMIYPSRIRASHVRGGHSGGGRREAGLAEDPIRRCAIRFRGGVVVTDDAVVVEIADPQGSVGGHLDGYRSAKLILTECASGVGREISMTENPICTSS